MRGLSIELKMIIGTILFAIILVGVERYQITDNIVQQFIESKKSKNRLLIEPSEQTSKYQRLTLIR